MYRRATTHALVCALALLIPASATAATSAGTGGAGLISSGSGATPSPSASLGAPPTGNPILSANGNGITLLTHADALLHAQLRFSGTVTGSRPGQSLIIERHGAQSGGPWTTAARSTLHSDGTFSVVWSTDRVGRFSVRARVVSSRASASRTVTSPQVTVNVLRPAIATLYGPGFFGSQTACGQILRPTTLGVAHRTLPCGTRVMIMWHGRTIVVPVIDRGPYANGADWDLTTATATKIGINDTATIGAVALPH